MIKGNYLGNNLVYLEKERVNQWPHRRVALCRIASAAAGKRSAAPTAMSPEAGSGGAGAASTGNGEPEKKKAPEEF